jgi:glycosyltransferase involved in cell wall biosynthesis
VSEISLSVVIPVFNMESTVGKAIDSVLSQTFDDLEVIVVDDGSTDATAAALDTYRDTIKVITQEHDGSSAAYNRGARAAKGRYIAFLDADDLWLKDMLSKTIPLLEDDGECSLVFANALIFDYKGRPLGLQVTAGFDHAPSLEEMLSSPCPILPSMCVMRKAAFESAGRFWEEPGVYRACADVYLMLRLREVGPFRYLPEPLVIRREASYRECYRRYAKGQLVVKRLVKERYGDRCGRFRELGVLGRLVKLGFVLVDVDPRRLKRSLHGAASLVLQRLADAFRGREASGTRRPL